MNKNECTRKNERERIRKNKRERKWEIMNKKINKIKRTRKNAWWRTNEKYANGNGWIRKNDLEWAEMKYTIETRERTRKHNGNRTDKKLRTKKHEKRIRNGYQERTIEKKLTRSKKQIKWSRLNRDRKNYNETKKEWK